ncbi:PIG-L family deacetylase [Actinomadura rudentiformis]|uniref:PIG-L family deacetylase n=1 Tax=Actinomadura rudentiformis TaxID=359158 RepID=A0A6H9Z193_9ACTN|nr:PIG-L family deacetylase [Actinomadura rudentiformis]KAB2351555.1 hypothetical protein F8566_04815 [Actinomadura rudentiformis]
MGIREGVPVPLAVTGAVVVSGLAMVAGVTFAENGIQARREPVPVRPAAAPDGKAGAAGKKDRYMQVVAHADDDLLFMNPDIRDVIAAGRQTVTVFLTAGEGYARGYDPYAYSASRERGIRQAYARMAGVRDRWTSGALVAGPLTVQVDTLTERPTVRLVWFRLPDGADKHTSTLGKNALKRLQRDLIGTNCVHTVVPAGSPFSRCASRADVLAALQALMKTFGTTVVRHQDTQPHGHDHKDHVAAARLTAEAVRGAGDPRLVAIGYVDYAILRLPVNLGPGQRAGKKAAFEAYRRHDRLLGPQKLPKYWGWTKRMYRRWPGSGVQLARGSDGLLRAFAVEQGGLYVWTQRNAGEWSGPLRIDPGFPLSPGITVGSVGDQWMVAARRADDTHGLVVFQAGRANAWQVTQLGAPGRERDRKHTGSPAVTATADGRIAVFVRTGAGTVAMRMQGKPLGTFGKWRDLGGRDLRDGLAVTPAGRSPIEVFAASDDAPRARARREATGRGTVMRWRMQETRPVRGEDIGRTSPAGPLRLSAGPDARTRLLHRDPRSGQYLVQKERADGTFAPPVRVGGVDAVDAPALATSDGGQTSLICARGGTPAGISCSFADGRGLSFGRWFSLGGPLVASPSVAFDSAGRAVVAALGDHGRLLINRQTPGAQTFEGWHAIAETP